MNRAPSRRELLLAAAGGVLAGRALGSSRRFEISVAAWSLHREIQSGRLTMHDALRVVREELDLGALELVNTLLEVPTAAYVDRLRRQAEVLEVKVPLIMCDDEGALGAADPELRRRAVRHHRKWLEVGADLGCRALRVNWEGATAQEQSDAAAMRAFIDRSVDGFHQLIALAAERGIDVIVENHGGPSSDPRLLVELMRAVDSKHFGTLPDFGNFPPAVDIYQAIDLLMPWAKAVSAKCFAFDGGGEETTIDFERMLRICVDRHSYHGFIGIEFEGLGDERAGIRAARDLLRRLRAEAPGSAAGDDVCG